MVWGMFTRMAPRVGVCGVYARSDERWYRTLTLPFLPAKYLKVALSSTTSSGLSCSLMHARRAVM